MAPIDVAWTVADEVRRVDRITSERIACGGGRAPATVSFVHDPTADGWSLRSTWGSIVPVPPFDETPEVYAGVATVPGVDVAWSWSLLGGPFGTWTSSYVVVDGRPVAISIVEGAAPAAASDVWITFPYRRGLEVRRGRIGLFDVLSPPGTLDGDVDVAMVMAGLLTPAWTGATPLVDDDLALLGLLDAALDGRSLTPPEVP